MKRTTILLLSACMLLSLNACNAQVETPTTGTTAATIPSTENTLSTQTTAPSQESNVQQMPMAAVSMPIITESDLSTDKTVIFRNVYQNFSLITPDPEVADKIIVDFLNRTDVSATAESICTQAHSAYSAGTEFWVPFLSQITYDPMRIDHGVLSLFGNYATYTGAAHAETVYRSVNYDLTTGEVLDLESILTDNADSDTVCKAVLDSLAAQKDQVNLYEGYEATVKDRFAQTFPTDNDWFFTNEGLCFFFSPYEIGPYTSGAIVAQIPYASLIGILNDAYFPAERENATGTVSIAQFKENDLEHFSQFAEVMLEGGNEKILLYTDESVFDVQVETGVWSADGATFTPDHTVLALYTLTPGDAVMINTQLTESLPTVRLCYTTNDTTAQFFITKDAESGVPVLAEG